MWRALGVRAVSVNCFVRVSCMLGMRSLSASGACGVVYALCCSGQAFCVWFRGVVHSAFGLVLWRSVQMFCVVYSARRFGFVTVSQIWFLSWRTKECLRWLNGCSVEFRGVVCSLQGSGDRSTGSGAVQKNLGIQ